MDRFAAEFGVADPNERVRLMRSLPDQLSGADSTKARTLVAKQTFASLMSSEFSTIRWRPDKEAAVLQAAYRRVEELTEGFARVSVDDLTQLLTEFPQGVLVLRTIAGYTRPELSDATAICEPGRRVTGPS